MDLKTLRNVIKRTRPNWPLPTEYIGGGFYGRVYGTNNGHALKVSWSSSLSKEFSILKNLRKVNYVPKVRNGNYIKFNENNSRNVYIKVLRKPYTGRNAHALLMSRVGGPTAMTLRNYINRYGNNKRVMERKRNLLTNLHVRGFSHSNSHNDNVIVSVSPTGKITGMWLIDFGKAEKSYLGSPGNPNNFARSGLNWNNALEYVNKLAKRREEINKNLKLLSNSKARLGHSKSAPARSNTSPGMRRKINSPRGQKRKRNV